MPAGKLTGLRLRQTPGSDKPVSPLNSLEFRHSGEGDFSAEVSKLDGLNASR